MNPQERLDKARAELQQAETDLVAAQKGNDSRSRGPINHLLHEVRGMLRPGYPFASQAGQDRVVEQLLKGKTGGTFVEIGAYDGITGSNSIYFEKWRRWTVLTS